MLEFYLRTQKMEKEMKGKERKSQCAIVPRGKESTKMCIIYIDLPTNTISWRTGDTTFWIKNKVKHRQNML